MFKKIAIVVVVVLAAVLGLAATRPDTFHVERMTSINAAAEKIFPLINDFSSWSAWSPYEKLDPDMKRTRSGPRSGTGAVYAWEGNGKVGAGRMEIVDAPAPSKVVIKLGFSKPFEAHNIAQFNLAPRGNATNVTWSMDGPSPFVAKLMGLFFDMDNMVGRDFEIGLANLKSLSEK